METVFSGTVNSAAAVQDPSPGQRGPRPSWDGPLMAARGGRAMFLMGVALARST